MVRLTEQVFQLQEASHSLPCQAHDCNSVSICMCLVVGHLSTYVLAVVVVADTWRADVVVGTSRVVATCGRVAGSFDLDIL